jgi:thioesterase domain-containing protein
LGLTIDPGEADELRRQPPLKEIARRLVTALLDFLPQGPYRLTGHSMHGLYAYEIARQLHAAGHEIEVLALIDSYLWTAARRRHSVAARAAAHIAGLVQQVAAFDRRALASHLRELRNVASTVPARAARAPDGSPVADLAAVLRGAAMNYDPEPSPVPIHFFEAGEQPVGRAAGAASAGPRSQRTG